MRVSLLILFIVSSAGLLASPPVAKMVSPEPFVLAGTRIDVAAVSEWPVVDGDEVATLESPGAMIFPDGSFVELLPHSKINVRSQQKVTVVELLAGEIDYLLAASSSVRVSNASLRGDPIRFGEGHLTVGGTSATAVSAPAASSLLDRGGIRRGGIQQANFFGGGFGQRPGEDDDEEEEDSVSESRPGERLRRLICFILRHYGIPCRL